MTTSHSKKEVGFNATAALLEFMLDETGAEEVTIHMVRRKLGPPKLKRVYRLGFWWVNEDNQKWHWFHILDDVIIENLQNGESPGYVRHLCRMAKGNWESRMQHLENMRKIRENEK